MLDVRNQTIPIPRIQAVRIRQPLLWRPFGWVRIEIDVAGYGQGGQQESGRSALVPVAPAAEAFDVLHAVLATVPAAGPDALELQRAPRRARWRAPFQHRRLAYAVTDAALVTRSGWLTARHDVALYARARISLCGMLNRPFGAAVHSRQASEIRCRSAGVRTSRCTMRARMSTPRCAMMSSTRAA